MSEPTQTKKHVSLIGMEPVTDIESYDAVPWFRKTWFALFPLFAPALFVAALTGDVYAKANTEKMKDYSDADVWRYTAGSKAFFVVATLSSVAYFIVMAISLIG